MSTRHEKNVQRKLRAKERSDAMAKALRATPLRPIKTCNLQVLQQALGLPLDPCLLPKEEAQENNFGPESLDNATSSKAVSSNLPHVPLTESAARTTSKPTVLNPGNFGS